MRLSTSVIPPFWDVFSRSTEVAAICDLNKEGWGASNGVHVTCARCRSSNIITPYTGLLPVQAWLPRKTGGHKHVTPGVIGREWKDSLTNLENNYD